LQVQFPQRESVVAARRRERGEESPRMLFCGCAVLWLFRSVMSAVPIAAIARRESCGRRMQQVMVQAYL